MPEYLEAPVARFATHTPDVELAGNILARHLDETSVAGLQRDLLDASCGALEAHLLFFLFYVALVRGYAGSARHAVLVPLPGRAGGDSLGQGAWLALDSAATRGQSAPVPQCFVVERAGRRYLALAPYGFSERFLGLLWGNPPHSPSVIDVCGAASPWCRHQAYADAAYILARPLADPSLSLRALCGIPEQLSRSIG